MFKRLSLRLVIIGLAALVLLNLSVALAVANTVPASWLDVDTANINANLLKPPECASLNLTGVVVCSGTGNCAGSGAYDLLLGSPNGERIGGGTGSGGDCILGGGGDDILNGRQGTDVLLGGDGDDQLNGGGGDDYLYGGPGDDILEGGAGDDFLDGGPGTDDLDGGGGTDTCVNGESYNRCP